MDFPLNVPQYLFDDSLIDTGTGDGCFPKVRVVRRWLPCSVLPNPVLRPEMPWEGKPVRSDALFPAARRHCRLVHGLGRHGGLPLRHRHHTMLLAMLPSNSTSPSSGCFQQKPSGLVASTANR